MKENEYTGFINIIAVFIMLLVIIFLSYSLSFIYDLQHIK
jgi:VIT1/CCC1 family predicted Fe2+/Mn2+ transporter